MGRQDDANLRPQRQKTFVGLDMMTDDFKAKASDKRNWQAYYDPKSHVSRIGGRQDDDNRSRYEKDQRNERVRIQNAKDQAANEGQSNYEMDQANAETKKIKASTARFKKASIGGKQQRSSAAARGVAAQRQMASRRSGRGSGQATQLFDAPLRMRT